jgi:hypothetical protein
MKTLIITVILAQILLICQGCKYIYSGSIEYGIFQIILNSCLSTINIRILIKEFNL